VFVPCRYKQTLQTYDSQESGRTYVNVDLATAAGIKEAGKAGLASSPLVDAIFTPLFHTGIEIFNKEFKARLYTLMRHPVDRTVSEYYTFTQNAAEEILREMTLEEYINSRYYIGNHMTSFIGGCWSPAITDDICLQVSRVVDDNTDIRTHNSILTYSYFDINKTSVEQRTLTDQVCYWPSG